MSKCPAKIYSNVTPEAVLLLKVKLSTFGIEFNVDTVDDILEVDGITVEFLYNKEKETVVVQVTNKPFFVTCHEIQTHFDTVFTEVMAVYPKITISNSEDISVIKESTKATEPVVESQKEQKEGE